MPENPARKNGAGSHDHDQNPKWWNPIWTGVLGGIFVVYVAALFIACRYWVGHPNDTPAFVSGVIGILTLYAIIVQVAINRHQWKAMREGLDQQRELFELAERPSLAIEPDEFEIVKGKPVVVRFAIVNNGKSPAIDVRSSVALGMMIDPSELGLPSFDLSDKASRGVITVGGRRSIAADSNGKPLTEDERYSVLNGEMNLFVWGRVEYKSIHGRGYFTQYCASFDVGEEMFIEYSEGNDAN